MAHSKLSFRQLDKYYEERDKYKIKCKCGHTMYLRPHKEKILCSWCHNYVVNPRQAFKDKLGGILNVK